MTNEEALTHLKQHDYWTQYSWQDEVCELAISALENIDCITAERDAAVSELKELASCKSCKHNACSAHDEPCLGCEWQNDKPNWEWRGIE